jgi:hypothetical protein
MNLLRPALITATGVLLSVVSVPPQLSNTVCTRPTTNMTNPKGHSVTHPLFGLNGFRSFESSKRSMMGWQQYTPNGFFQWRISDICLDNVKLSWDLWNVCACHHTMLSKIANTDERVTCSQWWGCSNLLPKIRLQNRTWLNGFSVKLEQDLITHRSASNMLQNPLCCGH